MEVRASGRAPGAAVAFILCYVYVMRSMPCDQRLAPRPDSDFDPLHRRTILDLDYLLREVKYNTVLQTQGQTVTKQGAYYSESPR